MNRYILAGIFCLIPLGTYAQQCTQAQLSTEFSTDPAQKGYASCTNDTCYQQKLNEPCTGNANCGKVDNILSNVEVMQTIIDSTELETLANSTNPNMTGRRQQLDWLLALPSYNMAKAPFQQKWKNVFKPADSPLTNAAINAAQQKDASRCQTVCSKTNCTLSDVSLGLRGTP